MATQPRRDPEPETERSAPSSAPNSPAGRGLSQDIHGLQHDIHGLQRALQDRWSGRSEDDAARDAQKDARTASAFNVRRAFKIAAGLALVAVFGWVPLKGLLQRQSVEAVVNSRIVTLRAPIDGKISELSSTLSSMGRVSGGATVLRLKNTRADSAHLNDLRHQLAKLESERPSLVAKIESARREQRDLELQVARFTAGRIQQLEARIAEIQSIIEAAAARREEATAAVERATSLARSGSISTAEVARLTRDRTVAEQTELGARKRLDASRVELAAAREGTFLGDSYNDRPSSVQRLEEIRQRADTLSADLANVEGQIAELKHEVIVAEIRYDEMSDAKIIAPIAGRIWEIMTSPGEDVRAGQPLLRILDCSGAVVTANVTETVYNRLRIGSKAVFRPADGSPDLDGVVANLTGSAGAAANLAISPDVLNKEPYRVIVSVPKLADQDGCTVGRTGRVIFPGDDAGAP